MAPRPALLRNLGLKILALAIGILVWFVLSARTRERISERSYRIALSVVNIPPRTIIASPLAAAVDVRVRGPFTALRQVDSTKLEAVVDLQGAEKGEKIYRLSPDDINIPPEIEVVSISPGELRIVLDAVADRVLPIAANLTGTPAAGYTVTDVTVEPRSARVEGPATALAQMKTITTDPVSLEGRDASFAVPATVLSEAPGVRVREGQIVTVSVHLRSTVTPAAPVQTALPRGRR
ncbi:MAG TPA: CdaR family protein [Thermoanaerobaculia bacterium]|nr:CdaR family protein [Thermoanaerobaculia bacterium]